MCLLLSTVRGQGHLYAHQHGLAPGVVDNRAWDRRTARAQRGHDGGECRNQPRGMARLVWTEAWRAMLERRLGRWDRDRWWWAWVSRDVLRAPPAEP